MFGLRLLRRRTANHATAAFHSKPPPTSAENASLLRDLETAMKTDPEAAQKLSGLLSPATTRNLSRALKSVRTSTPASETANAAAVTPPTTQELKMVALQMGLPFIGFGFVDNFIMIIAGDYIDLTLGVSLGISSMAAAGIGNTISDIAGLGLGNVVEDFCARIGLPVPALTNEQVCFATYAIEEHTTGEGHRQLIGVTIGCLLGMVPLLFLETRPKNDNPAPSKPTGSNDE
ncbi:hypothetical protein PInf_011894 [Phytophthora infestans]|nr:hypothetical protein PInf_011894 [Phytophthora infestans]